MKNKTLLIIAAVVIFFGLWAVNSYNGLIGLSQTVDSQWAQVETQYQRRFDLIPNLVEATKGTLTQEQKVFGDIANARQGYAGANTQSERVEAANQVESALARLLVIMENYPQLQSNQTVRDLMIQIEGTENRVSVERKRYNDSVQVYNVKVKTVPTNILANMFNFAEKEYFEAVEAAETAPQVDLSTDDNE